MAKPFSGTLAIAQGVRHARETAMAVLPYYLVASGVLVGVTLLRKTLVAPDYVALIVTALEALLFSAVAAQFYGRATKSDAISLVRGALRLCSAAMLVLLLFTLLIFLAGFFLSILSGLLLAVEEFDPIAAETDPRVLAGSISQLIVGPGGVILAVLISVMALGMGWLAARLVMFGVATSVAGKVQIFRTWGWTRGHGFRLLASGSLMVAAPFVAAILVNIGIDNVLMAQGSVPVSLRIFSIEGLDHLIGWPVFLLGHGFAVAAYEQLSPRLLDVEANFS